MIQNDYEKYRYKSAEQKEYEEGLFIFFFVAVVGLGMSTLFWLLDLKLLNVVSSLLTIAWIVMGIASPFAFMSDKVLS